MEAGMAFLSIIAIIGIVLVAGGLIAFIGNMIVNAFDVDKRKVEKIEKSNGNVMTYEEYKLLEQGKQVESAKEPEYDFDAINEAKAKSEQELAEGAEQKDIYSFVEEQDESLEEIEKRLKAESETEQTPVEVQEAPVAVDEDVDDLDLDSLLMEISNEVIDEEKENTPDVQIEMSDELKQYSIDNALNETEEAQVEETEAEVATEEVVEAIEEVPADEVVEEVPEVAEETKEVEKDNSNEIIESLKAQLADLNNQLEQARSNKIEVVTINMTEEECLARLELLDERLKNVKKEYKTNLKEYKPLRKVKNDLEKYQTKLRRKETKVANMKVSLYGVNNYVDLDKEKAEKLSNELELLDGLRFSVQHCEEVIANNKDRYPVLERTNNILEDQIEHIENDIATTQATLAKIREQSGSDEQGDNNSDNNGEQE